MKAFFLPKSLDGIGSRKFVIDIQHGCSHTDVHWHDCIEIVYVQRGNIRVFLNNKWHCMSAGDMVFLPPHRVHCVHCSDENAIKVVIGISKELVCDKNTYEEGVILPFETDAINEHCFFCDCEKFDKIFNDLCSKDDTYYGNLIIQSEILRLYALIYKEWQNKNLIFAEPITDKTVYKIINILEKEFVHAPTPYEMAGLLNMSYSNMSRIINITLGTNYNALLNSIRIENAKKLLVSTDKSITDICFDCGFQSCSYFIKLFKSKVGITPNKYRASTHALR